jgi:glycosyltransferase involved in cell wall biosynthesis
MTSKPKISVVICAYNAASCIQGIFDSLKNQTFTDFEIVVANDGSTDNTADIGKAAGARVIDMEHRGLSAARNVGINNSKADIVAIIDADCHASQNWLEEIHKEIESGETVVTGSTQIPKSTFLGDCISGLGYPGGGHLGFESMWPVDKDGYTSHLAGGNCAFRKAPIQALGAFNEKLTITGDDVYLSMKILESGLKIKYDPQMIMTHNPRNDLVSFLRWHYSRGKGSYFFKKHVGPLTPFYKLRLWSTKNMLRKYWKSPKIVVMVPLLGLSFFTQKAGYLVQAMHK